MDILKDKSLTKGYGSGGKEVDFNSDSCIAKELYDRDTKKNYFYVKFGVAGYSSGTYLNPYNPDSRTTFEFRRVDETQFELYLKFLRTRSERYLIAMRKT
jgi:hypothetical protein